MQLLSEVFSTIFEPLQGMSSPPNRFDQNEGRVGEAGVGAVSVSSLNFGAWTACAKTPGGSQHVLSGGLVE